MIHFDGYLNSALQHGYNQLVKASPILCDIIHVQRPKLSAKTLFLYALEHVYLSEFLIVV